MGTPFGEMLGSSDIFTFFVGEDKQRFIVHADCFATLSKPMHSLIKGEFKEASNREAHWPHVDATTFGLLSVFAYKGDYDAKAVPHPNNDPNPEVEVVTARPAPRIKTNLSLSNQLLHQEDQSRRLALDPAVLDPRSSFLERTNSTLQMIRQMHVQKVARVQTDYSDYREEKRQEAAEQIAALNMLRPDLEGINLKYDCDGVRIIGLNKFLAHFERSPASKGATKGSEQGVDLPIIIDLDRRLSLSPPAYNTDSSMAHCLTLHARLFVISQEKMMEGLKILVLSKIHWILLKFPLDRARLSGTIDVARYIFDNTYGDNDELRLMMADHFALNRKRDNVGGSKLFADVIEEGGEFARFLWRSVFWRRLN